MVLFYLFIQYYAVLNTLYSTNEAAYVKIGFLNLVYLYHYHIPTCLEHLLYHLYMFEEACFPIGSIISWK